MIPTVFSGAVFFYRERLDLMVFKKQVMTQVGYGQNNWMDRLVVWLTLSPIEVVAMKLLTIVAYMGQHQKQEQKLFEL